MQFLVLAYHADGALDRRLELRDRHVAQARQMQSDGNLLYGVALLDDDGNMCGSAMVTEFESRRELDRWLENEPYVVGRVWDRVEVIPCRVGPMFLSDK